MQRNFAVVIVALAILGLVITGLTSCTAANEHSQEIDRLVGSLHAAGELDGVVLVAESGKVIYKRALGIARCGDGTKNTIDTVFDLASITKSFTATAVLMLVEEGRISLRDPVRTHLPGFPYSNVTVEHLLTHTSGLPNYPHNRLFLSFLQGLEGRVAVSDDVLQWLATAEPDLDFPPGEQRRYSNTGYVILGLVVDAVSGLSWEQFLQTRIFEPLDMQRTFVCTPLKEEPVDRWSLGHERSLDRKSRLAVDTSGHSPQLVGIRGANGVFSTVHDLFRFDQALYSERLLSQETLQKAFQRFQLVNGELEPYGYGWVARSEIGESQRAIESYRQAVALDPDFAPSKRKLAALLSPPAEAGESAH